MLARILVLILVLAFSGCSRTSEGITDERELGEEQLQIGTKYYYGEGGTKNYDEALKWFRFAAEGGNSTAQVFLGAMYANGQGVPKDQVAAIEWLMLAAQQGDLDGQFNLGKLFSEGDVEIRNLESAYVWWFIAASNGDGIAQKKLRILEKKMTAEQVANARILTREKLLELHDW
jgi:TPR repeat protein